MVRHLLGRDLTNVISVKNRAIIAHPTVSAAIPHKNVWIIGVSLNRVRKWAIRQAVRRDTIQRAQQRVLTDSAIRVRNRAIIARPTANATTAPKNA